MALTQDQIMMLAHLADWAGSQMAPENPFSGYAQQYVASRNMAKMLQGGMPGQPGQPRQTPAAQAPASGLAMTNPFSPEYKPLQMPPKQMPQFSVGSESAIQDLRDQIFVPGVDARVDADNNVTLTRKLPATTQSSLAGPTGATGATARQGAPAAYNPFRWRG